MTTRQFTLADQFDFANFSHDFNPIHIDDVASRRLIYGQPVVHGVNAMLWALGSFAKIVDRPVQIQSLTCSFSKPIFLNEEVAVDINTSSVEKSIIRLRQNGLAVAKISLFYTSCDSNELDEFPALGLCGLQFSKQPDFVAEENLARLEGMFDIGFDIGKATSLYGHHLLAVFGSQVIAEMTAMTKVVGMHAPGLNSLFTEISLNRATAPRDPIRFQYKSQDYDERFRQLLVWCTSRNFDGRLKAFYRPPAVSQSSYSVLKQSVLNTEFGGQRALIVGGSRGLGEVTAKYLAAGGAKVLLTYNRGFADAEAIVHDISSHGGLADLVQFDITSFNKKELDVLDNFAPTDIYYFSTPFIFSGQKGVFSENRLKQFMDFYLLGFHRILDHFSTRGTNRYFCPSSVALDEQPAAMGEYCVAKAAAEAYCEWVTMNRPGIWIEHPRLPRLATDQTATIAAAENGDTALMLQLLRSFSRSGLSQ